MTELEFIRIWQEAKSPAEVEQKTNLSRKAIYSRVSRLRAKNVPLKYFRPSIPVERLIEVALHSES